MVEWLSHPTTRDDRTVLEPVTRATLVDTLARRIGDDILAGRYPPGTRLPPERALARGYGVTRTSLKHTLVRLEQAGLITTRHGVGSVVRDFRATAGAALLPMLLEAGQEGWLPEMFDARRLVGALIAREAAVHHRAADIDALRALVDELRTAPNARDAQRVEAEFHRVLARASGNRIFVLLVNTLLDAYLTFGEALRAPFTEPARLAAMLEVVVAAVARGNQAAAQRAADRYLARTGDAMLGEVR